MQPVSFKRYRFPPDVIRLGVWLYFQFTLSFRDVEEMLAQRGIEASYETIRCWTLKFGESFAQNLRRSRARPTGRWHLDEMVVKIDGKRMWFWRAVDDEGEVLDMLVQKRRNTDAALRLLRKLLRHQGSHPELIVTDGLTSYRSAVRELGCQDRHRRGRMCANNRAENSHLVIRQRERKQQKFKSQGSAQRFLATHAAVYNNFNFQRHLIRRSTLRLLRAEADHMWAAATTAA
jgi:putative transposase